VVLAGVQVGEGVEVVPATAVTVFVLLVLVVAIELARASSDTVKCNEVKAEGGGVGADCSPEAGGETGEHSQEPAQLRVGLHYPFGKSHYPLEHAPAGVGLLCRFGRSRIGTGEAYAE